MGELLNYAKTIVMRKIITLACYIINDRGCKRVCLFSACKAVSPIL